MPQHLSLRAPFRDFLHRLRNSYDIGASSAYEAAIREAKRKYCFNPYLTSECDVQVKLGGLLENYLLSEQLPFTVHAEMKIYGGNGRSSRCDLTIQRAVPGVLQTTHKMATDSVVAAIEIKYANAAHPGNEFKNGAIAADLDKLTTLQGVDKYFVLIDEAEGVSETDIRWLTYTCEEKCIQLFANNPLAMELCNYPFGEERMAILMRSQGKESAKEQIGTKSDLLEAMPPGYEQIADDGYCMELKYEGCKLQLCYSNQRNTDPEILFDPLLITIHAAKDLTWERVATALEPFRAYTSTNIIEVDDQAQQQALCNKQDTLK
ncbi:MAG: hypothetical protein JNL51_13350 [Chitinophagaceae bacterium]|nr:hypothetical protein [Chitinophagaceae bacterium]